jgi:NADPH-dependent 2,4-dienoyl-CoA reductase/sulfur reductase-like enzyme/peroxiredoxin family protein/rhodanese-related sulfurtransferase/TusA-related sulfurtransferase
MGATPVIPPVKGLTKTQPGSDTPMLADRVFTLRNIPDTYRIKDFIDQHQPKSAVVVGGGYIGIEMAENLKAAGLDVTVVEMLKQVFPPLDYEMACEVHRYLESKGVKLMLNTQFTGVEEVTADALGESIAQTLDGALLIDLKKSGDTDKSEAGAELSQISADMIMLAIGVSPENYLAKDAGLAINNRGGIIVDDHMRTADENIYAVGDVAEVTDFNTGLKTMVPLAGPANKQGRIAADNICGIMSSYGGTQGSAIIKLFDLTVAITGINEKSAMAQSLKPGIDFDKVYTYSASHAGYYPGATNILIKTLFNRKTGKILGAQLVGFDGTDKRCDVIATAMRFNSTAADLVKLELCYAPPYSSAKDPVNMAGFVIENVLSGKEKMFHWDEVDKLPRDGSVILIDTRTSIEYENGHIEGFINIPIDELRNRLNELDKTKKVYIHCQVGLRGYVAARILTQNGFDTYNLSGGYRMYHTIFGKHPVQQSIPPVPANVQSTTVTKTEPVASASENYCKGVANMDATKTISVDACGLQCPGPILKLGSALKEVNEGDIIEISATDPAFAGDVENFSRRTGNEFVGIHEEKGIVYAKIKKGNGSNRPASEGLTQPRDDGKNLIVFSGDLDKAIAAFIIANGSAAMGRKVSMFFTFWGLNILRKPKKVKVKKDFLSKMFGIMMPRGAKNLGLSRLNMGGIGAKLIRFLMKKKNIDSLESLMKMAIDNGVILVACTMSCDIMGIKMEELIDECVPGGVASMLAHAEESDMSLFI